MVLANYAILSCRRKEQQNKERKGWQSPAALGHELAQNQRLLVRTSIDLLARLLCSSAVADLDEKIDGGGLPEFNDERLERTYLAM